MNECLTYFAVYFKDEFDLGDFCEKLGLDEAQIRPLIKKNKIEIGKNENYNVDINEMLRETLKDLFGKEDVLFQLKEDYQLEYYLVRVPLLSADAINPILCLDRDLIEFLYLTTAEDELDYYVE